MRQRKPEILTLIEPLQAFLAAEKWKRERFCSGKNRPFKIKKLEDMLKNIGAIEEWARTRITPEEWKGYIE